MKIIAVISQYFWIAVGRQVLSASSYSNQAVWIILSSNEIMVLIFKADLYSRCNSYILKTGKK